MQARVWYEKAAAEGNAEARYKLGVIYAEGLGVPQDADKARKFLAQAAAQGHREAQLRLRGGSRPQK